MTRGREWDNVFPPRWISPINLALRSELRYQEAKFYCEKLQLKPYFNQDLYISQQWKKYPHFAPKTANTKRRGITSPEHHGLHHTGITTSVEATYHGQPVIPVLGKSYCRLSI